MWIWGALCTESRKIVSCVIGDRSMKTFKVMYDELVPRGVTHWFTDGWSSYNLIPEEQRTISKRCTTQIESLWSDMRLFIKGFNRRTKATLKSPIMIHSLLKIFVYNFNTKPT